MHEMPRALSNGKPKTATNNESERMKSKQETIRKRTSYQKLKLELGKGATIADLKRQLDFMDSNHMFGYAWIAGCYRESQSGA